MPRIARALISVFDKTGVTDLARVLREEGVEIISTGGTAKALNAAGIPTRSVSEITGFPEILDGRVKTLNPRIFGGLLARREDETHRQQLQTHGIETIDLVVVNLYPFEETVAKPGVTLTEALEHIDIGGPAMIRAAAKNFPHVAVLTSPEQYEPFLEEFKHAKGEISLERRRRLAAEAFQRTSAYDSAIASFLAVESQEESTFPATLVRQFQKVCDLRYGENPHQGAAAYRIAGEARQGVLSAEQLHGKELSFNNMLDLDTALNLVRQFEAPCAVIIKHTNPCGVATGATLQQAYADARATDPVSAFGSIIGFNRPVDVETAQEIASTFVEAIIAPDYAADALKVLTGKKNLRLLRSPEVTAPPTGQWDLKRIQGGVLFQDQDLHDLRDIEFKVVTQRQPTEAEWAAMKFGWRVAKWVKSNAIVFAAEHRTIGIGAGQMSRVDSAKIAVEKARSFGLPLEGTALASDAFFPFRDGVDVAAEAGATAVIQPGGSIRDDEVVAAADERNLAMVFTGIRHFRH